jgi:hypothetical protein
MIYIKLMRKSRSFTKRGGVKSSSSDVPPPPPGTPPPKSRSSSDFSNDIIQIETPRHVIPTATEQQKEWAANWIPKRIKRILKEHPELLEEYLYNKKEFQDRVLSFANKTLGGGLRRKKRSSSRTKKYRR